MKKLVLIPYERYQQLIKRECKGEEDTKPVESELKEANKEVESVPEVDVREEIKPDAHLDESSANFTPPTPPPPGEPVNVNQFGEGYNLEKVPTRKRKNKAYY